MRRFFALTLWAALALSAPGAQAQQSDATLADIRQELNVLFVEIQRLKREMSTTGAPAVQTGGTSVLERVAAIEAELQRLTARTERIENRVDRIVTDGTNRIGDLEFRLVELEGGDIGALGETTTLGGETALTNTPATPAPSGSASAAVTEMAIGEEADFQAATKALDAGEYQRAVDMFGAFNQAYPGSPLAQSAEFSRGKAYDGLGDTREAARAYLAAFSANSTSLIAPDALYELGAALGRLDQRDQACITLGEVAVRFPSALAVTSARNEMARLSCN